MDEEEEQRRSVRDFIVATDIYIYIYITLYISNSLLDAYKKNEAESSSKEKRRGGPVSPPPFFVLCVPKKRRALLSVSISAIGNNLTAYTNELDL